MPPKIKVAEPKKRNRDEETTEQNGQEIKQGHKLPAPQAEESSTSPGPSSSSSSLIAALPRLIKTHFSTFDYMALLSGSWSAMGKLHGPLLERVGLEAAAAVNNNSTPATAGEHAAASSRVTVDQLEEMSKRGARQLRVRLEDPRSSFAQQLRQAAKPGVNVPLALEPVLHAVELCVAQLVADSQEKNHHQGAAAAATEFSKGVRPLVVHYVGFLYRYAAKHWFLDQGDLDSVLRSAFKAAVSDEEEKERNKEEDDGCETKSSSSSSAMATMAPMMTPIVISTIQQWAIEYDRTGDYLADCKVMTTAERET